MSLGRIAAVVGGTVVGDPEVMVTGPAAMDSRLATPGGLFVGFDGEYVDGHSYAVHAGRAGAVAAMGTRPMLLPTVVVEDSRAALQALAVALVGELRADLTVLAVTGSSGKTSTKDMMGAVLSSTSPTITTLGNLNNDLGVPLTMSRAESTTRTLVLEMGACHLGEITMLTDLVAPDIAVVLNVGQAHLGEYGSREAIARTKSELVQGLAPGGTAILNADDPAVMAMRSLTDGPVLTFGRAEDATVRLVDLTLDHRGRPSFTLQIREDSVRVTLPFVGAHFAHNASAAAAAALAAGIPLAATAAALATATLTKWRMEPHYLAGNVTLLNDSYNANPDSARAGLDALAAVKGRRHIAVLGNMAELGVEAADLHRLVGSHAATRADVVIAVGELAGAYAEGAGEKAVVVPDNTAAVAWLREHLTSGDVVLVKGSRSARLDEVAAALL